MKILFLSAEAVPLSKVGGLGDVAGSLAKTLAALGHDVRLALPFTGVIDRARVQPESVIRFQVPHLSGPQTASVSIFTQAGVTFYLIAGPPIPRAKRIYGSGIAEDGPKFIFFSLAALGVCRALEWAPDILHAHDAHPGPAVYWLATEGARDPFFQATASVVTIHNLAYLNPGAAPYLRQYGLAPSDSPLLPDWARDSLMGLGLAHADVINAVSPTYAREILTPELGCGLDGLLVAREARLSGILNGIDVEHWNPARDKNLKARFNVETLEKRAANKRALQKELGLPLLADAPLAAIISRVDYQKGVEIAIPAVRQFLQADAQFVLLGTGEARLEAEFKQLGKEFKDRASINLRFDEALARRIYAGTDLLLIPSRFEPCGLTQMLAMRYGAVPVVRRTGGLVDTVTDYSVPRRSTGFVFTDYNATDLVEALRRALAVYRQPARWRALQVRGMRRAATHFSWAASAQHYLTLYKTALAYHQAESRLKALDAQAQDSESLEIGWNEVKPSRHR